jgi:hypothetical protein
MKECPKGDPKEGCYFWVSAGDSADVSGHQGYKSLEEAFAKGKWVRFPDCF